MADASIITIGDELLIGQVVDTNSAWMAQQLNLAGVKVKRRVAVGDVWEEIWTALEEESKHSEIIFITGGLGPTEDDITKAVLCAYFEGKMIINEEARANVNYLFEKVFKRPVTERNLKQAEVPDNCMVIQNKRGSAPGMLFEKHGKLFISMPGVPHEMKGMMELDVIPRLLKHQNSLHISHRTLVTFGIGESSLADMIQPFSINLPQHIKLAYLPNHGLVRLRLSSSGTDALKIEKEIDDLFNELQSLVRAYMICNEDQTMEQIVGHLLKDRQQTMCTAESCTGGFLAHLVTLVPGASAFYQGSLVTYSYQAKEELLGVSHDLLALHGAVSEAVVIEMAKGALQKMRANYTIAISGIMGPGGGLPNKPVGTVWVAVGNENKIVAELFNFRFDRQRNIQLTAANALNLLRKFILENPS